MKKILFIFLLLNNLLDLKAQQNINFIVRDKTVDSKLEGYIYSAKNLKFKEEKEIVSLKNQFKKVEESVTNFGLSNDENWICFDVKNESFQNKNFVLFLDQTFLEKADFYLFEQDSLVQKYNLNDKLTAKNKPFTQINFVYPFTLKQNTEYNIFLRIKANPDNGVAKVLMTLFDETSFFENQKNQQLTFGILIGFLLLSFITGITLYFNARKEIYVIYIAHILIVAAGYLSNYGYLNGIFGDHFLGSAKFYQSLLMLGGGFQVLFIRSFLDLPQRISRKYDLIIIAFSIYFFFWAIANFIFPIAHFLPQISRISLILLAIFLFSISIWIATNKDKTVKFYLLAMTPGLLLILYLLLSALNILPISQFAFSILFFSSVYEIIVFGFGLVYVFSKEKEKIEIQLVEERRQIAQKLITTQEQERQRIAQDLHDDLGSTLSMLKNKLSESNETLDNQLVIEMNIADKAVNDLRVISHNLTPALFLQKGLKVAIEENAGRVLNPASVSFMCSGIEKKLDWETELSIFRITKELLNNALKHAKASNIEVQLIYFDDFLYLSVEDNGIGYVKFESEIKGIGLKNVSLRVNYLNGKMNQESSEHGTLITIEIPYEPSTKNQNLID